MIWGTHTVSSSIPDLRPPKYERRINCSFLFVKSLTRDEIFSPSMKIRFRMACLQCLQTVWSQIPKRSPGWTTGPRLTTKDRETQTSLKEQKTWEEEVLRPQGSSLNSQAMDLKQTEDMPDKRHQQGGKVASAQIFKKTTTANPPRVQCASRDADHEWDPRGIAETTGTKAVRQAGARGGAQNQVVVVLVVLN